MAYLARFDESGKCKAIYLAGTKSAEELVGCVEISDEEWAYYIGNRGMGDNGTGYIRDPKTGKPVSAPPAPPVETTETPAANVPETEIAVMEGMVDLQSRIAALEEEIARLKGGNGQ